MTINHLPNAPSAAASAKDKRWNDVLQDASASWYLDPLVAQQKRQATAALMVRARPEGARCALKTDSFEEAYGEDSPLADLLPYATRWLVIDGSAGIVRRARSRRKESQARFIAADVRALPFAGASIDLVFSNSTLDHFDSHQAFDASLQEIVRVLRPGGRLVLTLDNPFNPTYWLLRALCATGWTPYPLGYTPSRARLCRLLDRAGMDVTDTDVFIHNPRVVSTMLFIALRRLLGHRADRFIAVLLAAFQVLDRLPTRRLTSCFYAVWAVRRPIGTNCLA